jgi:predicted membrane metal-binding protein
MFFALGYLIGLYCNIVGMKPVMLLFLIPVLRTWMTLGLITFWLTNPTNAYFPDIQKHDIQHQFLSSGKSQVLITDDFLRVKAYPYPKSLCFRNPDIFHQRICLNPAPSSKPTYLHSLYHQIESKINTLDWHTKNTAAGVFLGKKLDADLQSVLQRSGLYHVVVVSGFHMSFLGFLLQMILLSPLRILLAYKLIGPISYNLLEITTVSSIAIIIFHYAWLVGMGPASQRACLLYILTAISLIVYPFSFLQKCLIALVTQVSIFPFSFLSVGNLMSWTAYICVCKIPVYAIFVLFLLSYFLFDQNELIQIPVNFLVLPLFTILIPFIGLAIFFPVLGYAVEWLLQHLFQLLSVSLVICEDLALPLHFKPVLIIIGIIALATKVDKRRPRNRVHTKIQ